MNDINWSEKTRLRSHFGFTHLPFANNMKAAQMFDSSSQRELLRGLQMWSDVRGLCLVSGPPGVGKSITLRRFASGLDQARWKVIDFSYLPSTPTGFLRTLCRKLGLPMRLHGVDLFDQAQYFLVNHQQEQGVHPIILVDDGEGLPVAVIDLLRRLTSFDLDSEDRFSIVLSGTEDLLATLAHSSLEPLRTRFSYVQGLRPFGLEDTRNYIQFHLTRAETSPKLFSDPAIRYLFSASAGRPRSINQLALQALIQAAVQGRDEIDGDFMNALIQSHPLFQIAAGGGR
jgi:type II secretory pathway predicted ATPase ExeA